MKLVKLVLLLVISMHSVTASAEDWITEEVLKQLSEVRQELKVLQQEVRGLKDQLAQKPSVQPSAGGTLSIADAPFAGEDNAEIAIVEFSDYQCPYCRRHFQQTLPEITKNYIDSGKVKYVMKQFPLGFHAKARGASIAALCIDKLKPGSYWKAHEAMFSGETKLANEDYLALAESLKIKSARYESCLSDPAMAKRVDNDMREGESIGVSGTPAFYIGKIEGEKVVNGQLVTGARPYSSFSAALGNLVVQ